MLGPKNVDSVHKRGLLERYEVDCVCSLGLPLDKLPMNNPEGALDFLKIALDKSHAVGAKAMSGVIHGAIGQRAGFTDGG
jgi:D-psicose/D-tagatose/L-ribulose 3-epimerase